MKAKINELVERFPAMSTVYIRTGVDFLDETLDDFGGDVEARNDFYNIETDDIDEEMLYIVFDDCSNAELISVTSSISYDYWRVNSRFYCKHENKSDLLKAWHIYQELHDTILGYV